MRPEQSNCICLSRCDGRVIHHSELWCGYRVVVVGEPTCEGAWYLAAVAAAARGCRAEGVRCDQSVDDQSVSRITREGAAPPVPSAARIAANASSRASLSVGPIGGLGPKTPILALGS